ncbi:MAG: 16S rRNA (guanine(966)-N(2))-methyltransferase RsmD [Myxococcales bacterium]|nr:16S rRNA (guanine(966)-N(2))-methyltransferase RsmD [Myxococcales bacterium]
MRIVGGELRGRRLFGPKASDVRPTSDRVREAIFDLLGPGPLSGRVLDLFAGTGALGIEALSRGCERAVFVESAPAAAAVIRRNLETCRLLDRARIARADVARFLSGTDPDRPFALILLDPPYRQGLAQEALSAITSGEWVAPAGVVVAEAEKGAALPERVGGLGLAKHKIYGDTAVFIYRREGE